MFGQRQASDSTLLCATSLPHIVACISTSPLITAQKLQNYYMLFLQSSNKFPSWSIVDTCQDSRVISVHSHEVQEILFTLNLDLAEFCSDKLHDKIDFRANCSNHGSKKLTIASERRGFSPAEYLYIKFKGKKKKKEKRSRDAIFKKARVQGVHSKP